MSEGLHILIVEDNEAHLRLAKERIKELGRPYELEIAADGEAALYKLGVDPENPEAPFAPLKGYDVVIVDLNLPVLDGRDLIEAMRQNITLTKTPIIILTASLDDRELLLEHCLPPTAYIEKPITTPQLRRAIATYPHLLASGSSQK